MDCIESTGRPVLIVNARRSQTAHAQINLPRAAYITPTTRKRALLKFLARNETVPRPAILVTMSTEDVLDIHHHEDDTEGVVLAKGVSMAVLFCASMICGLAPLLLAKKFQWVSAEEAGNLKSTNRVVMTLLSFGGGVLLSTTFMHLMPEVDHNVVYLQREYLFICFIRCCTSGLQELKIS